MGVCLSHQVKADNQHFTGSSSKTGSKDRNHLSDSSSKNSSVTVTPRTEGEILKSPILKKFSLSELRKATRNFRSDSVLGEGGFGSVFKGWIDENSLSSTKPGSGTVIAVKRLNLDGCQGHREWLTEINYLGQLQHPNLVRLIGYCLEDDHRLLIYEYMVRGSMEHHLFRRGCYYQPLSWGIRMKIALGAAKGLAFLHSAERPVIYRDFKTSNILLDSEYTAKLSDLGLARDGPTGDESHVTTRVMGTFGYAAPEYIATGHLTRKSDVYSFGVVFLEMLSGRKAMDINRPHGEHNLVEWAKPYLNKQKMFRIIDGRLDGQYSLHKALRAATLALQCLTTDPRSRPSMDEVVLTLEKLQDPKDIAKFTQMEQNSNSRRATLEAAKYKTGHGPPL